MTTALFVGGGVLTGFLLIWLGKRWPRCSRVIDFGLAAAAVFIAVLIGLGHFDRADAIWPVLVALNIVTRGFGGTRARKEPAVAPSRPAATGS